MGWSKKKKVEFIESKSGMLVGGKGKCGSIIGIVSVNKKNCIWVDPNEMDEPTAY